MNTEQRRENSRKSRDRCAIKMELGIAAFGLAGYLERTVNPSEHTITKLLALASAKSTSAADYEIIHRFIQHHRPCPHRSKSVYAPGP